VAIRHKCFLSHHGDDRDQLQDFIDEFDEGQDAFITRSITMPEDIIDSDDPDYVMRKIRERFLKDSTVTIVMIGECTWARKFVDWEVQASLRRRAEGPPPNGLFAILLDRSKERGRLPDRVKLNRDSAYAKFCSYPSSAYQLSQWIDEAYYARTENGSLLLTGIEVESSARKHPIKQRF
jgi:hypothetical protein